MTPFPTPAASSFTAFAPFMAVTMIAKVMTATAAHVVPTMAIATLFITPVTALAAFKQSTEHSFNP